MHAAEPSRAIDAPPRQAAGPFERARRAWRRRAWLLPLVVLACTTLPHLGQGQFQGDTAWYSAIALEAWRAAAEGDLGALWTLRGHGGLPTAEQTPVGPLYFNKPPLAFWIHGLALWLLGPSLWAARLPAVLAGAGIVALAVSAAARLTGRRAAVLTGIVLAATLEFTRHLRMVSLDVWQLLFLMGAVRLVVEGVRTGRAGLVAWSGLPLGLALLTKPLVALLALPMLAAWMAWEGRGRLVPALGLALPVALAVAAPWHVSMAVLHGEAFTSAYFGREIAARAAGSIAGLNAGADSAFYYAREVAALYWPWLLLVALAVVAWGRGQMRGGAGRGMRLAVAWSVPWLVALSAFADKRPRYLLPVYPAWAAMSALWIAYAAPPWYTGARRRLRTWWPPLAVIGAVALAAAPVRIERARDPDWAPMFAALRAEGVPAPGRLWDGGGAEAARGARVYMELGYWPRVARGPAGRMEARPGPGDLVFYHASDGWAPGDGEVVLFRQGDLTLTRLVNGEWKPRRVGGE